MNIHDATEEAYKRGIDNAIEEIGDHIAEYIDCVFCPCPCGDVGIRKCRENVKLWMRSLFEGGNS